MSLRSRTLITTTVAGLSVALALSATTAPTASARSAPSGARTLDSAVLAPFQVAVRGGTVWWTDGFKGTVTRLRNGQKKVIVQGGAEGVAVSGNRLAVRKSGDGFARLVVRSPHRKAQVVDIRHFEA